MSRSIFGCVVMGSVVLSIWSPSCVLYSAGSGVSSVKFVLSVLRSRSLSVVYLSMSCCCCLPSETYGRIGVTPIFRSFHRTAFM